MPKGTKLSSVVTIVCLYDTIISLITFIIDIITKKDSRFGLAFIEKTRAKAFTITRD